MRTFRLAFVVVLASHFALEFGTSEDQGDRRPNQRVRQRLSRHRRRATVAADDDVAPPRAHNATSAAAAARGALLPRACVARLPWLSNTARAASERRAAVAAAALLGQPSPRAGAPSRGPPGEGRHPGRSPSRPLARALIATPAAGKGGVGNTLRALVSAFYVAAIARRPLYICWGRDTAHLGELLRPPPTSATLGGGGGAPGDGGGAPSPSIEWQLRLCGGDT